MAVDKADSPVHERRDPSRKAAAAQLHHGCPHRARPISRIPHLQLRPHDEASSTPACSTQGPPTCPTSERVDLYFLHEPDFKEQIQICTTVHKNLAVLDLRGEAVIYAGNRFMIYALFPQCNISMHVLWGLRKQNTVFAVGKSILDRSSKTNVGELMLAYEGGGHDAAGTCQIDNARANDVLAELIGKISADG